MKAIIIKSGIVAMVFVQLYFVTACNKEKGTGYMTVKMTDAPAAYTEVNVDVTGLMVHHETSGWVNVAVNSGVYNLLDLQNDVSVVLASGASLPVGKITQVRLILGSNNSLTINGDTGAINYPLTVPSGSETGLKVNINTDILAGHTIQILLDFDANASVVDHGNGTYSLKPVIKVESVVQI